MKPEIIDGDVSLLLELVRPLSTVLVLDILPFWANTFLEEMVIGLEGEFGSSCDVVLRLLEMDWHRG